MRQKYKEYRQIDAKQTIRRNKLKNKAKDYLEPANNPLIFALAKTGCTSAI